MKKIVAVLLVALFAVALMAGCGPDTTEPSASPSQSAAPSASESTAPSTQPSGGEADTVKTGLAITNSVAKSKDAGEEDGLAQADSIIVAVTVDNAGVITDCVIDMAQSKVNFSTTGTLVTPMDATFMTKNELGAEYGLGDVSSIGKEWNEQAAALAAYVIGKTADEVQGIAVDESGHPTGSDLTSSVTVSISGYLDTIVKAVNNAADYGAMTGDKVKIATVTNISHSTDATAEADGLAQVYSTYVAITQDTAGTITSCIFDASQSDVNFDTSGIITNDLSVPPMTKDELGPEYGMGAVSSIGKEWNEQAAAFAAYVTGKTVDEVKGIAVTEDGHAESADLTASVTIHITDFIDLIEKAAAM